MEQLAVKMRTLEAEGCGTPPDFAPPVRVVVRLLFLMSAIVCLSEKDRPRRKLEPS